MGTSVTFYVYENVYVFIVKGSLKVQLYTLLMKQILSLADII